MKKALFILALVFVLVGGFKGFAMYTDAKEAKDQYADMNYQLNCVLIESEESGYVTKYEMLTGHDSTAWVVFVNDYLIAKYIFNIYENKDYVRVDRVYCDGETFTDIYSIDEFYEKLR